MAALKRYKVILCPNCGLVQSTASNTTFKCLRCGKSRAIFSKTHAGLNIRVLDSFDHPKQAALYVQEYQRVKSQR